MSPPGPSRRERADVHVVAAIAATVLWSAGNVLVRKANLPGPQLAFWRCVCGALAYNSILVARGGRMSVATVRRSALGGFGFGAQASLYFTALKLTTVTSAAVIGSLQPLMLLPIAAVLHSERITVRRTVLVAAALTGTVLVVLGARSAGSWSLGGDLLALVATALGCCYFVGTKNARRTLGTFEYQGGALIVAAMAALVGTFPTGGPWLPSGSQLVWPVVMTLVPGTGHLLMSWAQRHLSIGFTSTISLDVLLLTVIGAAVIFDEPIKAVQVVGVAVVIGSLAVFVATSGERVPAVDPATTP